MADAPTTPDESNEANFQSLVLERLDQISEFQGMVVNRLDHLEQEQQQNSEFQSMVITRLGTLEQEQKETNIRLEAFQKGSEGVVGMAKTIIITAGASVIFAPLLRELAPAPPSSTAMYPHPDRLCA